MRVRSNGVLSWVSPPHTKAWLTTTPLGTKGAESRSSGSRSSSSEPMRYPNRESSHWTAPSMRFAYGSMSSLAGLKR